MAACSRRTARIFPAPDCACAYLFRGSLLPEERQPAALKALAFQRLPGLLAVPLAQVPGVLLAEAYADYHAVATSGAYDEHWESKVPF